MAYPLHRPSTPDGAALPASPDLPRLEREVLSHWQHDGTFQASIDARPADREFVFYDGPPFANGLPHYGHLLTGYAKDVVGRYRTQRGYRVERRFGWDTHGLPAELEAERILGITDKSQIDEMGIDVFNAECRESVLRYTKEWRDYVTRQARWVDFDNDYKTLDLGFMESVLWAFKQLHDKGLAYEGYRVLPYCWRDETPLSNHELRMDDDVYASRQDPALTVGVRLETGDLALVWTTTPWTLPSNLAVAVGPDIEYVRVCPPPSSRLHGEVVLLAASRLGAYERELGRYEVEEEGDDVGRVLERVRGADLLGRRYTPPFGYFEGHPNAHRVLAGDFVTTEDGTGLVHLAPAFGEDDMAVCDAAGITPVVPVDSKGRFTAEVRDYAGLQVFEANPRIIADLKSGEGPLASVAEPQRAVVVRHETYDHSYPHCWRCRNPLIYRAVSSWFVRVTQIRDRMVELNGEITWVPDHIQDGQFGKWLAGARDWSISRNRYWGTPIPVWVSDDPAYPRTDVYGSIADLERDFGVEVSDLHRPYIDQLTRPNPDDPTGQATMRRIPDVLDVWFDSGSMPFAQVHYPFENAEWFESHYPGDFITEYIGQTRGWFYTLHVLATALFDRPAFRTAVSHGIVLGSDGRKMSKSLRNYPDVTEVFERDGSDAMRWFLMASPILRGGNLVVTEEGIRDGVRQVLLPVWSTYYFFTLYAGAANGGEGYEARAVTADRVPSLPPMDRYLLARTRDLVDRTTAQLDAYDIAGACETVREHLDMLTNWYVRTQRDRFWEEDADAFDTLWTALEVLARVLAPLAPLLAEEVWRGLTGGRSVHLTDWPADVVVPEDAERYPADPRSTGHAAAGRVEAEAPLVSDDALVAAMEQVREIVSVVLGLRKAHGLRVRQPLRELGVALADPAGVEPYAALIASELNVRHVTLVDLAEVSAADLGVTNRLAVNARAAGPRLGRRVQDVIRAARAGEWDRDEDGAVVVRTSDGPVPLEESEYELTTVVAEREDRAGQVAAVLRHGGVVLLDTTLDDELVAEGWARDVVRLVQDERKAAGLQVTDRIRLRLTVPVDRAEAAATHRDMIARETLALEVDVRAGDVDGAAAGVSLERAAAGAPTA